MAFEILIEADGSDRLLLVDGTLREIHSDASAPTEYPVGDGRTMTDHIQTMPSRVSVDIIVTETPIRELTEPLVEDYSIVTNAVSIGKAQATSLDPSRALEPFERAAALHGLLDGLRRRAVFLAVTTHLARYPRMVITRIEAPVESAHGEVTISIDLQAIEIARSQVTQDVLVEEPRLRRARDRGDQSGDEVSGTEGDADSTAPSRSAARGLEDFAGGLLG